MICPRCHAENLSGTRFCGQCGTPLSSICGSCGASNPAENKFCGQCGTSIVSGNLASIATVGNAPAQAGPTGEFKQVTVLFCDIVNSTGLAERIGAEPLHELLRRFLDTGIAEVRRFGGTVPQFTGDGFMALFGAPIAHEDHVRRALLAAVAIRRAVAGNAEGLADPEAAMPIRIGLNTGLVVFGPVADKLRMDSTRSAMPRTSPPACRRRPSRATSSSVRQPSGWHAAMSSPSRSEP